MHLKFIVSVQLSQSVESFLQIHKIIISVKGVTVLLVYLFAGVYDQSIRECNIENTLINAIILLTEDLITSSARFIKVNKRTDPVNKKWNIQPESPPHNIQELVVD